MSFALKLFTIFSILFFFSCAQKSTQTEKLPPKWIYGTYQKKGSVCGIGISLPHIKGKSYQRATAIARAIDEIARQMNVRVNTTVEHFLRGSSSGVSSGLSSYSIQTTTGQVIRAKIEDIYLDPKTEELYILMCTY